MENNYEEDIDEPIIYDDESEDIEGINIMYGLDHTGTYRGFDSDFYEMDDNGITVNRKGMKDTLKTAKHYIRQGTSTFGFVDDVVDQIPAAFYRPTWDSYNMKAFLEKRDIVLPKLYRLPDEVFETIIKDISSFWNNKEAYDKFGNVYKHSILLYSVPGNGKTSLINMLAFELINEHNGIILTINSMQDLIAYPKNIERIRQIEPDRKIITIVEDFDGIVGQDKNGETLLLQILDGNNQYSGVVTIATTNNIDKLSKAFLDRPSRFNSVIEYKKPNEKTRHFYFESKLKDSGFNVDDDDMKQQIERLVNASENFTFDYCKELLELIFVRGKKEEEAIDKVKKAMEKKGIYKLTEEKQNIGI